MESTGKLAWLRHGPEIHKYITEELGGVLLEKHTKTGLNTSKLHLYFLVQLISCVVVGVGVVIVIVISIVDKS